MPKAMTEWPDRPTTPNGGDEYQENLHGELRMGKSLSSLLLLMNIQDAKFNALGAKHAPAPERKKKIGVNSERWNVYVATEDVTAGAKNAGSAEAATQCGMDSIKTCNHALCKSKTIAQAPLWSPFPTRSTFAADTAETRDTVAPGWFSHLAGVPEGTEIAFDTSAPGFAKADQAAKVASIPMAEAEKIVKEAAVKIAKEMAEDAKAKVAEENVKASKKRILIDRKSTRLNSSHWE